ncbi:MAG TPA: hypothetical protein PLL77_06530 [Pyrinomonadaceae bacterium]|nr:hypothetical protein [Pyrinomonadaceae bacterium]
MLGLIGWLVAVIGMIWLVVTAIQTGKDTADKAIWGLVNFFCQPLGGIVFYFVKKQGLVPLLMVIAGWILVVVGGGMSFSMGNLPQ